MNLKFDIPSDHVLVLRTLSSDCISSRIRISDRQVPTGEDDTVKEGFVMFLSFALFGAMPLLG